MTVETLETLKQSKVLVLPGRNPPNLIVPLPSYYSGPKY
jgi:hypothetical protein